MGVVRAREEDLGAAVRTVGPTEVVLDRTEDPFRGGIRSLPDPF
ncbi:hypothetical protein [Streptomyces sp. NBC_00083]|nr:hypothetical protein [Streptomyces sp. NBC_00083]MCX5382753.1 hypothetical protein [Streptomyces sp. NBC_00083]